MTLPYERIKELVIELSELPANERTARVDAECHDDDELRTEILALLELMELPDSALDSGLQIPEVADPVEELPVPQRIGGYRIVRRLATGGMGTVFVAEQEHPHRTVALKTIRSQLTTPTMRRRFAREAELLGRLQHRGIAQIFEAGTFTDRDGETPFFVLELVEGRMLTEHAHRLRVRERIELVVELCDAVQHAHDRGVVHRDLKPDNILVDATGQPKILDFGVARALDGDVRATTLQTQPGQLIGTLPYMSPEQVAGDPNAIDARCDVYALGVILYELLAGRRPLDVSGQSIHEAARVIREDDPQRLGTVITSLRGDLETIALKALSKEPDRRYPTPRALADDLQRHLSHAPITARPPSTFYQLGKFARRNATLVVGVAATLAVSILGAIVATLYAVRATRNEAEAQRALALARVTIADSALEDAPRSARDALDDIPAHLRNWEWHYLDTLLQPAATTPLPAVPNGDPRRGSVAFGIEGSPRYAFAVDTRVEIHTVGDRGPPVVIDSPLPLRRVLLAPTGTRLAGIDSTSTRLLLWDVHDRRLLHTLDGFVNLGRLAFSGRDARLLVADGSGVRILNVDTGSTHFTPEPGMGRFRQSVLDATGRRLLSNIAHGRGSRGRRLLDLATGEVLWRSGTFFASAAFMPDDAGFAMGNAGQQIHVLAADGTLVNKWKCTEIPRALAFNSDGTLLAAASARELRVWDVATASSHAAFAFGAHQVALARNGSTVLAATSDGAVLNQAARRRSRTLARWTGRFVALAFHPGGNELAAMNQRGSVRLIEVASGRELRRWQVGLLDRNGKFRGRSLAFSDDGGSVYATGPGPALGCYRCPIDGTAEVRQIGWDDYWGRVGRRARLGNSVGATDIVCNPSGKRTILVRDRSTDGQVSRFSVGATRRPVSALAVSADGQTIASGHHGGTICLWRRDGTLLGEAAAHDDIVYRLDFSPDGSRLVSGGLDFLVRLWDVEPLEQVLTLRDHEGSLRDVAFSPDGSMIASCGSDGTVRIWGSTIRND